MEQLSFDESSAQPIQGNQSSAPQTGDSSAPLTFDESTAQPISGSSDSGNGSFTTPGGSNYTPGQTVTHSSGTMGEVTGQHPVTGNAQVKWHMPDATTFKRGQIVSVGGDPATVVGYNNNGKLLVEGKWGKFGGTKSVSPADVDPNPGKITSAASGVASSFLDTAAGAAHMFGAHPEGLENAQAAQKTSQEQNHYSGEAGHLIGDLAQFIGANGVVKAGTGALTALPAVEQFAAATKIAKVLADHPVLAKILHAGINGSVVQGTISGVTAGGDPVAAAKGAALGAGAEIGGEFAPEIIAAIKAAPGAAADAIGSAVSGTAKAAGKVTGKVADVVNDTAEKVLPNVYPPKVEVPTAVEKRLADQGSYDQHATDIRNAFVNSLKEDGIDLNLPKDIDVRKVPDLANKALENKYKGLYGKIDEALEAEGYPADYQAVDKEILDTNKAMRQEPDLEKKMKYQVKLAQLREDQATMRSVLKDAGLGDLPDQASSLYKKSRAIEEVKDKIVKHTADEGGVLPRTNPNSFSKALNNLKYKNKYGGNRLHQAFGESGGDQLIEDTKAAQQRVRASNDNHAALKDQFAAADAKRALARKVALGAAGALGTGSLIHDLTH